MSFALSINLRIFRDRACCVARNSTRRLSSGKRKNTKRPRLKTAASDLQSTWYTPNKTRQSSLDMGRYGLKRLDYSTLEPQIWTLPPQPPTKKLAERIAFPLTLVAVASIATWAYLNPEEDDMREYWKKVETGKILVDDDDDDDDWDDDDEEED